MKAGEDEEGLDEVASGCAVGGSKLKDRRIGFCVDQAKAVAGLALALHLAIMKACHCLVAV